MRRPILLPIPLEGAGTADVESLPSYIHRLSQMHGVKTGVFLRHVLTHSADIYTGTPYDRLRHLKPQELVVPEDTTFAIMEVFEHVTGYRLRDSILMFLRDSLGKSRGEVVNGFRWCPECLKEMEDLGHTPYFKLIWHLKAIKSCPIHRTPLESNCWFCGDHQAGYRRIAAMGNCQNCLKPLSDRGRPISPDEIEPTWSDFGFDLIQLFEDIAENPQAVFPEDGILKSYLGIFDYYWNQDREEGTFESIGRKEFMAEVFDKRKSSLLKARRMAFRLGVPLYSLLSGKAHLCTEFMDKKLLCKFPSGYLDVNSKTVNQHPIILKQILSFLEDCETPPPLKGVAARVGVSVGYISYRHPSLAAQVVKRYKEHVAKIHEGRLEKARLCALNYFAESDSVYGSKSRKHAYTIIRASTGLSKFLLKSAINDVYQMYVSSDDFAATELRGPNVLRDVNQREDSRLSIKAPPANSQ